MSSPDRHPSRRTVLAGAGAVGLAILLAACSDVRPLYAPDIASGVRPQSDLAAVKVVTPSSRAGMKIRNELIFGLNGGTDPDRAVYRLVIRLVEGSVPIGTEQYQKLPAATMVQLNAGFQLIHTDTGHVAFQGTSFANASYDYSSQRFANARARLNAEDRAAGVIATDIRAKLTAWFATTAPVLPAARPGGAKPGPTAAELTLDDPN